jgi:hypothetical protein
MERIIKSVEEKYLIPALELVESVFTASECEENGKLVRKAADAIGIGIFKWFKIAQHDTARMIIDGVSKEVAERNVTSITLNTAWSFTNLSEKINGGTGVQAFRTIIVRQGYLRDVNELVFRTSDGKLLRVGLKDRHMILVDHNGKTITSSDGKAFMVNLWGGGAQ